METPRHGDSISCLSNCDALLLADGARVPLLQPAVHTLGVEVVAAVELTQLDAILVVLQANRAAALVFRQGRG
jgi:hypothetical protein